MTVSKSPRSYVREAYQIIWGRTLHINGQALRLANIRRSVHGLIDNCLRPDFPSCLKYGLDRSWDPGNVLN